MKKYKVVHTFHEAESDTTHVAGSFYETDDEQKAASLSAFLYVQNAKVVESTSNKLAELQAEAKALKVKGYTKMDVEGLKQAIEAEKAKKASE